MATTTTWKIGNLERETADGYVYTAHYTVNATDETYSAGAYGSVGFEKPETLVPFADLTEETVVGWVKAKLNEENEDNVSNVEAALQAQLDEQKAPTKASGTPWS
tara:strand:+ start:43 stop:357 length:315 start_codon:yes stop_codon:yes gene_type:complete